jgi:hypothetical protein
MSSGDGFMAEDEDILSVLLGDNRLVTRMGVIHPQLAKPLFYIWNLKLSIGHRTLKETKYILYHNKKVFLKAHRSKPGQESIFNDGFRGGSHIDIWRDLEPAEETFLRKKYSHLSSMQLTRLIKKLSELSIGEMELYYIKRYGFF